MSRRDDGIADMDWAPFPEDINPEIQTTADTADLRYILALKQLTKLKSVIREIHSLTVWKQHPAILELHTTTGVRNLAFEFDIGHATFAVTSTNALMIAVWNADNTTISVVNLDGHLIKSGQLPDIPIGWSWQTAKFLDEHTLELATYINHTSEFSSLMCVIY